MMVYDGTYLRIPPLSPYSIRTKILSSCRAAGYRRLKVCEATLPICLFPCFQWILDSDVWPNHSKQLIGRLICQLIYLFHQGLLFFLGFSIECPSSSGHGRCTLFFHFNIFIWMTVNDALKCFAVSIADVIGVFYSV